MSNRFIDLTGQKFNSLTVVSRAENRGKSVVWNCLCDCGNETQVRSGNIRNGHTQSCGCKTKEHLTTHGLWRKQPTEHSIWTNMKQRCYNPNAKYYDIYGGRGITVCGEWKDDFAKFFEDIGERPSANHSLDRIDGNKGYSKDNCRWATAVEQGRNQRVNNRNKSGVRGVYCDKYGKYQVKISVDKKATYIGYFDTLEEATQARKQAEEQYWNN
jgi:hypothetical protein